MGDSTFTPPPPQQDFNGFVNGEFLATTTIPDDQSRWGSFMILREENLERCKKLCEENPDSLIGRVYKAAFTPPTSIDPLFTKAIQEIVETVQQPADYFVAAARLLTRYGHSPVFHVCKSEDAKNPELRVPHLTQSGLGLPDKSYYTEREDVHEAYVSYIEDIAKIFGVADGAVNGKAVLAFEKRIAEKHLDRAERRDPDKVYNKRDWSALKLGAFFDSLELFDRRGDMTYAIVDHPALLEHLEAVVAETDVATLRAHLIFTFVNSVAPYATEAAFTRRFDFVGKTLQGQKKIDPQWKRAVGMVESFIGDELGKLYVQRHFPPEQRETCATMVEDLRRALRETLTALDWMAEDTKKEAVRKLDRFGVKIGVPSQWHSIEGLWAGIDTANASLAELALGWFAWDWKTQEVEKFYTPPERELWHMTPQTVNAYYHPEMNEIVFPAGILQPPFFGLGTFEENLGAIGVVIGHEMTHGFDDQGRKYTADGNLKDWWAPSDATEFDKRAAVVRDHYGSLEVQGKKVNGQLTLGENIADIGGLKLALRALRLHVGGAEKVTKAMLERFFKAYAAIWRMAIRPETELKLLAIDPHSPCHLRVNAALGHIPEFYETFGVAEGDGMFLPEAHRMTIW